MSTELGQTFHIYNRGIDKNNIFLTKENYQYFMRLLQKYSLKYSISIIAFCLIPNHFHLMVVQDSNISVSRFIQTINNSYVQALNKQIGRKGTIFEGRSHIKLLDDEYYYTHLPIYIHLNPVKHKLVSNPIDWEFSNYAESIGKRDSYFNNSEFINTKFCSMKDYQKLVESNASNSLTFQRFETFERV